MNFSSITTFIKKRGIFKSTSQRRHPQRDWLFLVGATLLVFLLLALWSYVSFQWQVSDETETIGEQKIPELKTASIETVQSIFDKRAQVRADYQSGKHFIDPSK